MCCKWGGYKKISGQTLSRGHPGSPRPVYSKQTPQSVQSCGILVLALLPLVLALKFTYQIPSAPCIPFLCTPLIQYLCRYCCCVGQEIGYSQLANVSPSLGPESEALLLSLVWQGESLQDCLYSLFFPFNKDFFYFCPKESFFKKKKGGKLKL